MAQNRSILTVASPFLTHLQLDIKVYNRSKFSRNRKISPEYFEITISANSTVLELKQHIWRIDQDCPVERQKVRIDGKRVDDFMIVASLPIYGERGIEILVGSNRTPRCFSNSSHRSVSASTRERSPGATSASSTSSWFSSTGSASGS